MSTIGFCAIARDKDIPMLRNALDCVKGHADAIHIGISCGDTLSEAGKSLAEDYGADVFPFAWRDDFAYARNLVMDRCAEDWMAWADSDDEIRGFGKAVEFVKRLAPSVTFVLCQYEYSYFPSGKPDAIHPKERFIRMGRGFRWKGRLHESCVADDPGKGVSFDGAVWMHRATAEMALESSRRNIGIIESEIREQTEAGSVDPRTIFNLAMARSSVANHTQDPEDWQKSIRAFYDYLKVGGYDQHAYMAWRFIGQAFLAVDRPELSINAFFECLKLRPEIRDARALLGSAYLRMLDEQKAEAWFHAALLSGVDNQYVTEKAVSFVMPLLGLAEINAKKGRLDDADKFASMAEAHVGEVDGIKQMRGEIRRLKEEEKDAETAVMTLVGLGEDRHADAWEKLPGHVKAHPKVAAWRVTKRFKEASKGNEIAIYTGYSWEEWGPWSEKTGIGGSEEAVINMSRELVRLGWDVTVYGRHGTEPVESDGVKYLPFWMFVRTEPVDVFISWRDPGMFDHDINAKKRYLWLHDANHDSIFTKERLDRIDKVFVLSGYHRSLFPSVPDSKIFLTGNGILPEHFDIDFTKRKKGKFMYASAPDRGLECLLRMWPKIRESIPEAELYWAYGWNTFDVAMRNNPAKLRWKEEVMGLLKQPGVHDLGRIGHEDLARHMAETDLWLYPTMFNEIFCITAVKMQASGAVPVHSGQYAIGEEAICPFGMNLGLDKVYFDEKQQDAYVDAVVEASSKDWDRKAMSDWAKKAWAWSETAKGWDAMMKT